MKSVIILPTYNERENIATIIHSIFAQVPSINILVADDNSPDGTGKIVTELQSTYPNLELITRTKKDGLGRAYINAFRHVLKDSDVKTIIMMDADMSHQPKYLPEMLERAKTHSLVIGSRYVKGGGTVGWEAWRKTLSFFGNFYARNITRMKIMDCTGGFNAISTDLLNKIEFDNLNMSGYAFIMELKHSLYSAGAKVFEVPIIFVNRTGGESKISNHIIGEGVLAPWRLLKNSVPIKASTCPLCSSKAHFYVHKNDHDLYVCDSCKLMFVSPLPKTIDVYDTEYFTGAGKGHGYVDYDGDKEPMIPVFEKYLDLITPQVPGKSLKGKTLLDVGAATGFFMKMAAKRGMDVYGVEVADYAAQVGRDAGLKLKTGMLEEVGYESNFFDVVTLFDVLEHVTDPVGFLAEVKRIMKPGGLVLVNTPDVESNFAKALGKRWHLIVPPEHLHYFSPKILREYMAKENFETVVDTKIGKLFTFKYIFKMLYKWQELSIWKYFRDKFSEGKLSRLNIPINLYDNFFMIVRKK